MAVGKSSPQLRASEDIPSSIESPLQGNRMRFYSISVTFVTKS